MFEEYLPYIIIAGFLIFVGAMVGSKKKGRKGGGGKSTAFAKKPVTEQFMTWGKWFTVLNLKPRYPNHDVGQGSIPMHRIKEFFDLMAKHGVNCVTLKVAGYDFLPYKGWTANVATFMNMAQERGIWVQVGITDYWHAHKNNADMVEGESPNAKFNWWRGDAREAKKMYIEKTMKFFNKWDNVFWELGNEMDHSGLGSAFAQQAGFYLPLMRKHSKGMPIGVSENGLFGLPVDFGEVHSPSRMGGHPRWVMNEVAGETDYWRDAMMRHDATPYIQIANQVKQKGGKGVCACTWYDLRIGIHPNLIKVFQHFGKL